MQLCLSKLRRQVWSHVRPAFPARAIGHLGNPRAPRSRVWNIHSLTFVYETTWHFCKQEVLAFNPCILATPSSLTVRVSISSRVRTRSALLSSLTQCQERFLSTVEELLLCARLGISMRCCRNHLDAVSLLQSRLLEAGSVTHLCLNVQSGAQHIRCLLSTQMNR